MAHFLCAGRYSYVSSLSEGPKSLKQTLKCKELKKFRNHLIHNATQFILGQVNDRSEFI